MLSVPGSWPIGGGGFLGGSPPPRRGPAPPPPPPPKPPPAPRQKAPASDHGPAGEELPAIHALHQCDLLKGMADTSARTAWNLGSSDAPRSDPPCTPRPRGLWLERTSESRTGALD